MGPLVTIGIPTYNRPELLARALAAVAKQDYSNIEVLVADNGGPSRSAWPAVEQYQGVIRQFRYIVHDRNIGSIENFLFLLSAASGSYFMWLADDDEISANYVASLVKLLEGDSGAASAAGRWILMQNEGKGTPMPTSSFEQGSALARALRFIWQSDDAFFYALHRTTVLRQASFRGYSRPNRHVLRNWAYVYLLDVVLRGRVLRCRDMSVQFINHDYTAKTYGVASRSIAGLVSSALRRINVHLLFWEKCAKELNPMAIPVVVATSILSLIREGGSTCGRIMRVARGRSAK